MGLFTEMRKEAPVIFWIWIGWATFCVCLGATLIVVGIHFIRKFW